MAMKLHKGIRVTHGTDEKAAGTVIADPDQSEANPMIEVIWDHPHRIELIRSEYLYTSYVEQVDQSSYYHAIGRTKAGNSIG